MEAIKNVSKYNQFLFYKMTINTAQIAILRIQTFALLNELVLNIHITQSRHCQFNVQL